MNVGFKKVIHYKAFTMKLSQHGKTGYPEGRLRVSMKMISLVSNMNMINIMSNYVL